SPGDEEVGLDFAHIWCDVAAFQQAIAGDALREALDLYRGSLLEGFFISDAPECERWLETERARLREAASRAAVTLVGRSEECGNLTTAVHWARRGVELTPNEEGLVRRLIRLLHRHGSRAGRLAAEEEAAGRLRAEDHGRAPADPHACCPPASGPPPPPRGAARARRVACSIS